MKNQNRISKKRSLSAVIFALSLVCAAEADLLVELVPTPVVYGPDILLKEIVTNPSVLPEGWGERIVMRSPEPGQRAEHSIVSVAYALQKYSDMNDVLLHGQRNIMVRRPGSGMGSEKVFDAIKQFVRADTKWADANIDIQCEPIDEYIHIPNDSDIRIEIQNSKPQRETNRHLFETKLIGADGAPRQKINVYARIIPMHEVWATRKALRSGDSPGPEDIQTQLVPADTSDGYIPASEAIEGLELSRPIGANQPLPRRFLVAPICARRGDIIDVMATSGALTITARATALATGRRGDTILCLNENSNRRLRVRLTGMRRAEIDLGESG